VGHQVDPVQVEVAPDRLDVDHLTVAAVRRGVGGHLRLARAAQVEPGEGAMLGQAAEIAEVGGVEHRSAGQAEQRVVAAGQVQCETGAVVSDDVGELHARTSHRAAGWRHW
jgi:hypothetical protein